MVTYNLLKGRMAERGYNGVALAQLLGRNPTYVYIHLDRPAHFRLGEIYTICRALEIPLEEISKYFPDKG